METKPTKAKNEVCKTCGATYPAGGSCPNVKNHSNIEKGVTLEEEKTRDIEKLISIQIADHVKLYHAEETEGVVNQPLEELTKPELVKILVGLGLKPEDYKNKTEMIEAIVAAREKESESEEENNG